MRCVDDRGELVDDQAETNHGRRYEEQQSGERRTRSDTTIRATPRIEHRDERTAPQAARLPESGAAINGREERADGANAAAGNEVYPNTRFVESLKGAGVIRPIRARTSEDQRRPSFRRVFRLRSGE